MARRSRSVRTYLLLLSALFVPPMLVEQVSLDPRTWVAPALACSCNYYPRQENTPELVPRNFVASGWVNAYNFHPALKHLGSPPVSNADIPLLLWNVTLNKKIEATRRDVSSGISQRAELTPKSPVEPGSVVELRLAIDGDPVVLSQYKTTEKIDTLAPTVPEPKQVRYLPAMRLEYCGSVGAGVEVVFDPIQDDQSSLDQLRAHVWTTTMDGTIDESKPQEWAKFEERKPGEVVVNLGRSYACASSTLALPTKGKPPMKIVFQVVDASRNASRLFSMVVNDQTIVSTSWGGPVTQEKPSDQGPPPPATATPRKARGGCASWF